MRARARVARVRQCLPRGSRCASPASPGAGAASARESSDVRLSAVSAGTRREPGLQVLPSGVPAPLATQRPARLRASGPTLRALCPSWAPYALVGAGVAGVGACYSHVGIGMRVRWQEVSVSYVDWHLAESPYTSYDPCSWTLSRLPWPRLLHRLHTFTGTQYRSRARTLRVQTRTLPSRPGAPPRFKQTRLRAGRATVVAIVARYGQDPPTASAPRKARRVRYRAPTPSLFPRLAEGPRPVLGVLPTRAPPPPGLPDENAGRKAAPTNWSRGWGVRPDVTIAKQREASSDSTALHVRARPYAGAGAARSTRTLAEHPHVRLGRARARRVDVSRRAEPAGRVPDAANAEHRLEIYHSRQAIHATYHPNSRASRVGLELAPAANPAAAVGSTETAAQMRTDPRVRRAGRRRSTSSATRATASKTAWPRSTKNSEQHAHASTARARRPRRPLTDSVYTGCDDAMSTLPLSYLFWLPVSELQQFPPPFQAPMIEDLTRLSLSLPVIPMPAVPPSTFRRPSRGSGVLSALLVVDPDRHSMMTMTTTTTTLSVSLASPASPASPVSADACRRSS
ncbi:uncharacterized protein BXZ73DRAFT_80956 [Epithele typhae]|uniref:uncharacterized protein n=1 Tax=Epithele typhae TaxID=378194 RepID=UPI002008CB24|nr:uncharacterized protein BXZ73DRAFT_80956 [Epithele typhae]KAH9916991.1 hypothetical protein BXZ73DRAFT_80956 [Epithele typhae]